MGLSNYSPTLNWGEEGRGGEGMGREGGGEGRGEGKEGRGGEGGEGRGGGSPTSEHLLAVSVFSHAWSACTWHNISRMYA